MVKIIDPYSAQNISYIITLRVILFLSNELSIKKVSTTIYRLPPTTAQIFAAHQIRICPIRRYRIRK